MSNVFTGSGLEPEAPMDVNAKGGKQSKIEYAFTHVDPFTMLALGRVLYEGSKKYGKYNWRRIPEDDHLNHALMHLYAHMAGDDQDDHLAHALVRVMMALSLHLHPDTHPALKPPED